MDAKQEAKAEADAKRHAAEFRAEHNVSQEEWDLAEAMQQDLSKELLRKFWETA